MAKRRPKQEAAQRPSFEEALKQLEGIVHLLEEGDIGLNEALARYEEGVKLLRQSYDLLEHAERRIELLSGVDAEGNPVSRPFESQATLSQDADSGTKRDEPRAGENDMDAPEKLF